MSETLSPLDKKPKVQVLVFGHPLSKGTIRFLKQHYRRVHVHKVLNHVVNWSGVVDVTQDLLATMQAQGADLSGATETLIAVPGSSTSTATLVAALCGALGRLPGVLNLIRFPDGHYGPSPELPVLDLEEIKWALGRGLRQTHFNGVEILEESA